MQIAVVDLDTLTRNWWVFLLRGLAGILFGLFTLFAPSISLLALVIVFGAYAFADGVLAIISAVRRHGEDRWWVLLLQGLAGIAAGLIAVFWPGITALALLYVIAAWSLVVGAFQIAAAIRLRKVISHEWVLILAGAASVLLGIALFLFPGPGALAVVLWIGAFSLASGVLLVVLAFRLRSRMTVLRPRTT